MPLKKLIRKLHLILGLTSGLVVFTVAVSGCVYCFEKEIRQVMHRRLYEAPLSENTRANVSSVVDLAKSFHPGSAVKLVSFPVEKSKSIQVNFKDKTAVFVDPNQLRVLGTFKMETEFFGVVLNLHRNLLLGEPGKLITGCSCLIFLVMIITGIVMWWPRNRKALKSGLTIKKDATSKRTNFDLHRVLGFYGSFILIFSVLTGLIFSFKWAEGVMYWMSGSKKDQQKIKSIPSEGPNASVDFIAAAVISRFPDRDFNLVFPEDESGSYRVTVTETADGFFKKQHHLFFDQYSGKVLKEKRYNQASTGEHIRATNYDIHTGKVFGLFGQLLVFCASAIAASLPITGFLIWFARQKKKPSQTVTIKAEVVQQV